MLKSKPIYVEIMIETNIEKIWDYTQLPDYHEQWDLRFSEIDYLPKEDESVPQTFNYIRNLGCGMSIAGTGESVKKLFKDNGERMSSLKFQTDNRASLIKNGSGYWKYTKTDDGIRFMTQYDYKTRFGIIGRVIDRLMFKPLMGWATAYSFDSLRLWLEKDIHPNYSMIRSLIHYLVHFVLAFIWIYQGLIPKILFQEAGERSLLIGTGLFQGYEELFLYVLGIAQIMFGLFFLVFGRNKWLHIVNVIALICLGFGAFLSGGQIYAAPFNPTTLTVAMIGFSIISIINMKDLPNALNCKRKRSLRKE